MRYDAAKLNEVTLDSLKARSGEEVRVLYRQACQEFDQTLADRCLEEERAAAGGSLHGVAPAARQVRSSSNTGSANASLVAAFADGAEVCFLWGAGKCQRGDSCIKAHVCPFCGSKNKGCLLTNHTAFFKKHMSSTAGLPTSWQGGHTAGARADRDARGARPQPSSQGQRHQPKRIKEEDRSRSRSRTRDRDRR